MARSKTTRAGSYFDKKLAGTRILTFQEAIDLVRGKAGLYPELKMKEVAAWATGIGPNKTSLQKAPAIVEWAHAAKLTVTPWTFRASRPGEYPTVRDEMAYFLFTLGVDELFTDNHDMFPRTK